VNLLASTDFLIFLRAIFLVWLVFVLYFFLSTRVRNLHRRTWDESGVFSVEEEMRKNGSISVVIPRHVSTDEIPKLLLSRLMVSSVGGSNLEEFYKAKLKEWAMDFDDEEVIVQDKPVTYRTLRFRDFASMKDLMLLGEKVDVEDPENFLSLEEVRSYALLYLKAVSNQMVTNDSTFWEIPSRDNPPNETEICFLQASLDLSQYLADLGFSRPINFFFAARIEINDEDIRLLFNLLSKSNGESRFALLAVPGVATPALRDLIHDRLCKILGFDVILFDRDAIFDLIAATNYAVVLRHDVIQQIDLTKISPFTLTGPTPDQMFVGRENEIRLVMENVKGKSFAIIGGRRIGKTSMLMRLLKVMLPSAGIYAAFQDCSSISSYEDFLSRQIFNWYPNVPAGFPSTFGDLLLQQNRNTGQRIVFLLDEADKLIPIDRENNWKIFKVMRDFANNGTAQFILSGEQVLNEALQDPQSPLFNFPNQIVLSSLNYDAVAELIKKSLRRLEIKLDNEEAIVQEIYAFTSGHPNIVQRLCHRLIILLNQTGQRSINTALVRQVTSNRAFQREDFLNTIWESSSMLERIISLIMAKNQGIRTLKAIREYMEKEHNLIVRAKEIETALINLEVLRSILQSTPSGYVFACHSFPKVVAGTLTLEDTLEVFIDEYREKM
jgi:hypothetical protein